MARSHARSWLFVLGALTTLPGLALDPPSAVRPSALALSLSCAGCHGTDGVSHDQTPSINGRDPSEFVALMRAFQRGQKPASVMSRIAKGFTEADLKAMADYYRNR